MNTSSKFVVATHILTTLAAHQMLFGESVGMNSDFIAASVNTNPVVIRRLIGQLKEQGFVKSKAGPNGGSYLSKEPKKIRLSQIYTTVETGNLYHLHYSCPNNLCPVGANISNILSSILQESEKAFKNVLEKKTLFDIIQTVFEKIDNLKGKTNSELIVEYNNTINSIMKGSGLTK